MEQLITDNIKDIVQKIFDIIQKTIDNWKNVIPEGLALKEQCDTLLNIIIPRLQNITKLSPEYNIMLNMERTFNEINDDINEFIRKDEKERNLWGKILWKTKRIALCSEYRELFQLKSNEIQKYINEIIKISK